MSNRVAWKKHRGTYYLWLDFRHVDDLGFGKIAEESSRFAEICPTSSIRVLALFQDAKLSPRIIAAVRGIHRSDRVPTECVAVVGVEGFVRTLFVLGKRFLPFHFKEFTTEQEALAFLTETGLHTESRI